MTAWVLDQRIASRLGFAEAPESVWTPDARRALDNAVGSGLPANVTVNLRTASGGQMTCPLYLFEAGGQMVATWGSDVDEDIVREIGRAAATDALLRMEQRLAIAVRAAELGVFEWDMTTNVVHWSDQTAFLFGVHPSEFRGTFEHYCDLVHPDDLQRVVLEIDASVRSGQELSVQHRVLNHLGHVRWLRGRGAISRDAQGRTTSMIGVVWDVTEELAQRTTLEAAQRDLRRAKDRLEQAVNAAKFGVWEWNKSTDEFALDERARIAFGVTEAGDTIALEALLDRVHSDDRLRVWDALRSVSGHDRMDLEFRTISAEGPRFIRAFASLNDDRPPKLVGMCVDITRRKLTELRDQYRTAVLEALLVRASVDDVLDTIARGVEATLPACRVAIAIVDTFGSRLRLVAAPSLPEAFRSAINSTEIRQGNRSSGTCAALRKAVFAEDVLEDGCWHAFRDEAVHAAVRAAWSLPIIGSDDRLVGTLTAYFARPTEVESSMLRRLAESADFASFAIRHVRAISDARERHDLLELAAETFGLVGWQHDLTTNERRSTRNMAQLFGMEGDAMPAREDAMARLTPDSRERMRQALDLAETRGRPWDEYIDIQLPGGDLRRVRSRGQADMEDGKAVRVRGVLQDLTSELAAEAERAALHAQLVRAQRMESIGRLAGGMAHDVNNVLSVIMGHAELALQTLDPALAIADDLREIKLAAERSAALTQQLLAFARRQPITPKQINVNDTIEEMVNMLRRLIGNQISLVWRPDPALWDVFVDPSQIDQILANLCVNAKDAIDGAGTVEIETFNLTVGGADPSVWLNAGEYVGIRVTDTGCGIPKEHLDHVFEPFFSTKGVGKGTGLGLATVYGIVRQNRGQIAVTSEVGVGTTFSIYFPREVRARVRTEEVTQESVHHARSRVLYVEDEPALMRLGRRMLEGMGHDVIAVSSPIDALRVAEETPNLDLLVTDIVMPDMNGRVLADAIERVHRGIRKLFLSGYAAEILAEEGALLPGTLFLQKPFSLAELSASVAEALNEERVE